MIDYYTTAISELKSRHALSTSTASEDGETLMSTQSPKSSQVPDLSLG